MKIALFSLGNLAVHQACKDVLRHELGTLELCRSLESLCAQDSVILKYSQRLQQKLAAKN